MVAVLFVGKGGNASRQEKSRCTLLYIFLNLTYFGTLPSYCHFVQVQHCPSAASVRIVSIDDCYMQEKTKKVKNPATKKYETQTTMVYEVQIVRVDRPVISK